MKILSIRIKNLASLAGEHFIDFEAEPLANAGLVAIVGKTGAGKSTILDAMCLALFNRIPRLKDSDGKLLDVDGSELLTNSPQTVLRRGTAHGFAELCFVAQDQKHYLARWELKRSREKADGKLQSVQRYLKCLTDGVVVADKAKAVDANIYKITQLSFEQFTRAVLLAQSEVTAFLKARDNERGELLEYLTNSSIFGKIGQLAYEKTKLVASQRKDLENVLGHIEILSDEDFAHLENQFKHADLDFKASESVKISLEQQQQWFERKYKIDADISIKQQQVETQQQAKQNLSTEQSLLNKLEIFSSIRSVAFQQQQLSSAEQELAPKIVKQQQRFNESEQQFSTQRIQFLAAEKTLNDLHDFENMHRESLNQVRNCIQEREYLAVDFKKTQQKLLDFEQVKQPLVQQSQDLNRQIEALKQQQTQSNLEIQQSQQFATLDKGLTAHIQQLEQFIQHIQHLENQLGDLSSAESQLAKHQAELTQTIQQFGPLEKIEQQLDQLRLDRELKINHFNQFQGLEKSFFQYFDLSQESSQSVEKLQLCSAQIQLLETENKTAEQNYQISKDEQIKLQQILQQQRLLYAENIEHLRAELQEGQPCKVCGSTSHPYKTDDSALSKALFELQQQQQQQAEQKERECFKIWQNLQLKLTEKSTESAQLQQAIQYQNEKRAKLKNELTQQLNLLKLQIDFNHLQADIEVQLQQFKQQYQHQIQQIDLQLQQFAQAQKHQLQLNQHIQKTANLLDTAKNWQTQIQHIVACLSESEQAHWHQQCNMTAQRILRQLKQRNLQLDQLDQYKQQLDQFNQQITHLKLKLENIEHQYAETQQYLTEIKQKGQQNTEIASKLIFDMTGLNDVKPNEWLNQHDIEREQKQKQYQLIKQSFDQLRNSFEQQKNELDKLLALSQQNQQSLSKITVNISDWLNEHVNFKLNDLHELLQINPNQEQQIRNKIHAVEQQLSEALTVLKTLQSQLSEHLSQQPQNSFEQLQDLIVENTEILKQRFDQREQLKIKLEMHQQNLAKQKQFAEQIAKVQTEEHRWSKISGLMGDSTGKKFRDYAQQYNLDILLEHANQQLDMLSQRYTLKRLDNSLSLAIIDHDMDGETRSVASLSGGESFLTALALSLAIANMASGSMKIESLFIDEGFGTLDASSLHLVMNALDQLQNQGRKVVLISHIQDMHERIPVQIQVKPLGAGASTIQIVG
ncbi:SbcC/MukB-like Walker B domain-containing protein [Acinetobacter gerneri]|uniref:SbcC/MukB-like Walker B domain-containing protein n=1 Tax=Acinetobacter gerneri TaxID=202952 RepID=A0AAW8JEX5_9GAMM|nr:AAA family ATPase [Acinetobacter gerneri]MDQ9008619.1 SbcC/MukB-like Walker B domain-containing protein [Acinetobacter gerneri]MDQ9012833.1 SbcC/MukB-like Walker B domain-containing protein [Acinetobacter gerneri]MDQ9024158.1 SbcC/MukB-like Walker B domain-containing protein [Acinetobacter gerneri]MDQ9051395.1 SbcC/MukB-like Walker B domain-containing protein [Acinetobacter gerneri]MDQ9058618.1 SbcC/MukB-like Walker B domain-containing protein [Acinetobacter gerneri]